MIRRSFLGVDLTPQDFKTVALRRHGREVELVGARVLRFDPDVLQFSARETNVLDRFRFVSQLREMLSPLAEKEERLALSLPDRVGRTLLTEVESEFKSHQEGVEILKWQLKSSLPAEPRQTQIDFQVLGQTDAGRYRVMVAAIKGNILDEYQDAIEEAGFGAAHVDFHAMNLYNYYSSRFNLDDLFVLVAVEGDALSLQFFAQGHLVYTRSKTIISDVESVFQELSRTLVSVGSSFPQMHRASVFLHTDWEDVDELQSALVGCFEQNVQLLDLGMASGVQIDHAQPQALAAAIGAAERLM